MAVKKNKLHFVYAVPYASKYKAFSLNGTPLYRKYWKYLIKWPNPISAPFSLTYNILNVLDRHFEVLLYDVQEKGAIELGPNDIFIGHFWPDEKTKKPNTNFWTDFDAEQITNRTILKYPMDERVYVITPFNHSKEQLGWAIPLMKKVKHYIGICGDFWVDHIEFSPFDFLKGCIVNLNMGIDLKNYPQIKTAFNQKGERKFLYIGRISNEKNIGMLEQIASTCKDFKGGYIGNGIVKGWKQIAVSAALTPEFMSRLAREYDFFINTSTYDAQATTILEAMSWGFIVACTPETGYTEESIFQLSKDDINHNVKVVAHLNDLNEDEIDDNVSQNQLLLQRKFTWDRFAQQLNSIILNKAATIV